MASVDPGLAWVLKNGDPAAQNLARSELLHGAKGGSPTRSPRLRTLLTAPLRGHPYGNKWKGSHWRLVSLVELGVKPQPALKPLLDAEIQWISASSERVVIAGLERRHASMEGNALAVLTRLGLARDPAAVRARTRILESQWPDGGWNCDRRAQVRHSSFHESLATLWGLTEYWHATGDRATRRAASRATEFFLRHRLFRAERDGRVIDREWLKLHYPPYWHYDVLQALLILSRDGAVRDSRCAEALDWLESKRRPDGTWEPDGKRYWLRQGTERVNGDLVNWGAKGASDMLTLNALRVLRAAARWKP